MTLVLFLGLGGTEVNHTSHNLVKQCFLVESMYILGNDIVIQYLALSLQPLELSLLLAYLSMCTSNQENSPVVNPTHAS